MILGNGRALFRDDPDTNFRHTIRRGRVKMIKPDNSLYLAHFTKARKDNGAEISTDYYAFRVAPVSRFPYRSAA